MNTPTTDILNIFVINALPAEAVVGSVITVDELATNQASALINQKHVVIHSRLGHADTLNRVNRILGTNLEMTREDTPSITTSNVWFLVIYRKSRLPEGVNRGEDLDENYRFAVVYSANAL